MTLWQPIIDLAPEVNGMKVEYYGTEVFESHEEAFDHARTLSERFGEDGLEPDYHVKPLVFQNNK